MRKLIKSHPPNFLVSKKVNQIKMEGIITPDILIAILTEYNNRHAGNLELADWDAKLATKPGDNYMSTIYAVKLFLKNRENTETFPVMLKVLPRNELRVKMINEGKLFLKEVYMYSKIIPGMEKFQREVCQLLENELCCPWPKCYSCKTDGKGDYVAMEDLNAQGYKMASRQVGLDFEHSKLVLETMARFHAVSYAMFLGDFDKILEKYPWLEEIMYRDDLIPPERKASIKHTYQQQATRLREAGEEFGAHLLENIYSENYFNELYNILGAKVRWAIIGHGDTWTNNILFRYDKTDKPVEVKFVDYQVSRVCSRAVDIHYFLYSSLQTEVLNTREEELMQIYCNEFTRFAKILGVDIEEQMLTQQNFQNEIESSRFYGVTTGIFSAMITSAESTDVPEMENFTEEDIETTEKPKCFFLDMMNEEAIKKMKNLAGVHLPKCSQMKSFLTA